MWRALLRTASSATVGRKVGSTLAVAGVSTAAFLYSTQPSSLPVLQLTATTSSDTSAPAAASPMLLRSTLPPGRMMFAQAFEPDRRSTLRPMYSAVPASSLAPVSSPQSSNSSDEVTLLASDDKPTPVEAAAESTTVEVEVVPEPVVVEEPAVVIVEEPVVVVEEPVVIEEPVVVEVAPEPVVVEVAPEPAVVEVAPEPVVVEKPVVAEPVVVDEPIIVEELVTIHEPAVPAAAPQEAIALPPISHPSAIEAAVATATRSIDTSPVLVQFAGLRAQEFIELERHFREEMLHVLQSKEEEFASRLQAEREGFENYMRQQLEELCQEWVSENAKINQAHSRKQYEKARFLLEQQKKKFQQELLETHTTASQARLQTVEALQARVQQLDAAWNQRDKDSKSALESQQICLAIFSLSTSALDKPSPFTEQYQQALALTQSHEVIQQALQAIPESVVSSGVLPMGELSARFKAVRDIGRRDALVPANGGWWWQTFASGIAAITLPVRGWVEGDDPDAIFARAEYLLERGNLYGSLQELRQLNGLAAVAARNWIKDAQDRLAVEQALLTVRNYVADSLAKASQQ